MSYQVKLQVFEGPLDLLLFLIKKEEIDIYDIEIAKITKQYLEYIELMQMLDLEIAGEFIVMASTLMRIKVKSMLPTLGGAEEEVEELRSELVRSLLEYKKFKEVAEKFSEKEYEERKRFFKGISFENELRPDIDYAISIEYSIYDLITVFKHAIERVSKTEYYNLEREKISINQHIKHILDLMKTNEEISFMEFVSNAKSKLFIIVTFLAILELSRRGLIRLFQVDAFRDILIKRYI